MTKPAPVKHHDSMGPIIEAALELAPASPEDAAKEVLRMLAADERLYREIHDKLIERAVLDIVSRAMHKKRAQLFRPEPRPAPGFASIVAYVKERDRTLLGYALTEFGKTLADATRAEVLEMSRIHKALAAGNIAKAKWFDAIAEKMKDGQTVGASFDDAGLRKMAQDAGLVDL